MICVQSFPHNGHTTANLPIPSAIQLYVNQTSWKNVPKKVDLHLKDQLLDLVASAPGHMQPAAELWPLAEGSFEVMDAP